MNSACGGILNTCEDRRHIGLEEIREALEARDTAIEEWQGERCAKVGANLFCRGLHGLRVLRVGAHADVERRVGARQIRARIEVVHHPVEVERGIHERGFSGLEPEEVAIHSRDENVALEPRWTLERAVGDGDESVLGRVQSLDLRRNSLRAPVRQQTVELVPALHDCEIGMCLEVALNDLVSHGGPGRCAGSRCRFRLAAARNRHHRQE